MASIRGTIVERRLRFTEPENRVLQIVVRFEILDPEPDVAYAIEDKIIYPVEAFAGLTPAEIRQMIVNDGVGGFPSLRTMAQTILSEWNQMATLRSLPLPYTFTP